MILPKWRCIVKWWRAHTCTLLLGIRDSTAIILLAVLHELLLLMFSPHLARVLLLSHFNLLLLIDGLSLNTLEFLFAPEGIWLVPRKCRLLIKSLCNFIYLTMLINSISKLLIFSGLRLILYLHHLVLSSYICPKCLLELYILMLLGCRLVICCQMLLKLGLMRISLVLRGLKRGLREVLLIPLIHLFSELVYNFKL